MNNENMANINWQMDSCEKTFNPSKKILNKNPILHFKYIFLLEKYKKLACKSYEN